MKWNFFLIAAVAFGLGAECTHSQTLFGWDVNGVASGTTTLNATTAASNISGGQLSLTGITASGSSDTFGGSNWNLTNTFDEANKYFSFQVMPLAGYEVTYSSLQWDQGATSTAPNLSRWGYKIGTGSFTLQDPFSTPNTNSTDAAWNFAGFTATDTVEFRFWTYGGTRVSGGSAPTSAGASRIRNLAGNDLILFGSVAAIVPAGSSMFWTADGASLGGTGTWNATNTNWSANESPVSGGIWDNTKSAVFQGTAGTVTVGGISVAEGLLFGTTGYTLNSGTVTLSGAASANNTITTQPTVTATINSTLAGSNGLTKAGDGTLVLTGSNSYTGGTTISVGTLQLGSGSTSGSITGAVANEGSIVVNRSDALTLAGAISGNGSLTKISSGALTLSGSNSYSGGTTISLGTLQIGHNDALGTGSLQLGVTGTTASITFTSNDSTDRTISNALSTFAGSSWNTTFGSAGTGNLTFTNTGATALGASRTFNIANSFTQFGGGFSGTGDSITKIGNGTMVLNGNSTYTGATTINAGTLQIGNGGATGALSTSSTITNNATLVFNRSDALTQGADFSTAAITGTGSIIKNGTGNLTLNAANNYAGGTVLNTGTLNIINASAIGSGTLAINGGTLNNTSGSAITLSTNNAQSWNSDFAFTGTNDLNLGTGAVAMNATRTITVNGGTLTVGGAISGVGYGLTKAGAGNLTLSGANTYTGTTSVNAGTLTMGVSNVFDNSSNISIGGGTLAMGSNTDTVNAFTTTSGNLSGSGTLTASTYALQGGAIGANLGTGTVTVTSGTTTLSGTASSTTININSGNLTLGAANRLADGATVTVAGGVLNSGSFADTVSVLNMSSGSIVGSGTLTATTYELSGGTMGGALGAGTANVTGTVSLTGTMSPTTLNVNSGGTLTLVSTTDSRIGNSSAVTISGGRLEIGLNSYETVGSFTITSGTLSGQGTLHASSYALLGGEIRAILGAGAITVSTGTTTLVGSRLNDASSLTITSGNLTLGGAETVAALSGSGGTLNVGSHTITVNQTSDQTFSGVITGSGGLTKNGAGTLTLNGTNSYNGSTIVNSGTLEAKSAGALGSNNTVQINGGTLLVGADDAINGKNITLNTNGVGLRFSGNYSGAIGSLTLNADSIIDMGPGSVQILFQGLSLSSHTLSFYNWTGSTLWNGGTGADTDKVFLFPTIEPGDLNNISFYSGNGGDSFLGTGFDIGLKATGFSPAFGNQILPVPEPETWATAVILLVGGMVWFLKRARHPLKKKAVPIPHGSLNETE